MLPLVIFGVTILLFSLLQLLSPEMRASLYLTESSRPSELEAVIVKYRLRDPVPVQYGLWFKQVLHGNLGYSETVQMPVIEAIRSFFPATIELAVASFLPILLIGIWLGTLSAVHKDKWIDHFSRFIAITGYALPSFVLGLLLLMVFYGKFHILGPGRYSLFVDDIVHKETFKHFTGLLTLDTLLNLQFSAFWDLLKHLFLPALTLTYIEVALLVRITRSSMLEELGKDYIRTARAKGLPESAVVKKHARKNALIPVITLSSLLFVTLLGGVVITETVFNFPGIGRWAAMAAKNLDIPGVLGSALLTSILFVAANLVSDVLYALVDPRIRVQ